MEFYIYIIIKLKTMKKLFLYVSLSHSTKLVFNFYRCVIYLYNIITRKYQNKLFIEFIFSD